MSQHPAGSYETQFEAHSDDEENLFNVERILAERGRKYLVQWEGIDPVTGEKWAPDWVPKTDCTDDLIADWKQEKARMKPKKGASVKGTSSGSGSVDGPARPSKSRSVSGRSTTSRVTEASTSTRSRSPAPLPKKTTPSRRQPAFYIELPPRGSKRRRESDPKPEPMSPIKRMKLGGPASPLPASPFDNDDGGVGPMFPKKRTGPVTYGKKTRKPQVVKSPSFPKLTGPYVREQNVAESSRSRDSTHPEPTKRQAGDGREDEGNADDANTDTETEDESPPAPPSKPRIDSRTSPLKSKSEPLIKPRTRNATRNAPPEPEPQRASSLPFERPHPTSAARTRSLPVRSVTAHREIRKQISLGLPGLPENYPWWPRVVERDETLRRRSDPKSRTSIATNTSHKSTETSIAGPSVLPEANIVSVPEAEGPRPASPPLAHSPLHEPSPPPAPSPPPVPPSLSPEVLPKRSSLAKSTAGSSGRPSAAKSVSFRVEGVDDFDEYQDDYEPAAPDDRGVNSERVMSSIESENEPVSHEPTQQPSPIEQSQSQSQSNSDSSKSTHISDSQDGTEEAEKRDADFGNTVENEVEESEGEVENLELAPRELEDEEREGGSEEDQEEDQEDQEDQEDEQEDEHDEIQQGEEAPMHSSPSLGDDAPELPPEPDVDMGSPGRELSPPADIQLDESLDRPGDTGDMDGVQDDEQAHAPEELSEGTDADASMAHATEVDMLLSSDVSQRSEPNDEVEKEDSAPAMGDSTTDTLKSTADAQQEHHAGEPVDSTPALTDSSSGRVAAPDPRTAIDHPTTREVISTLLPGILDTPSQSQSQPRSLSTETQDHSLIPPALPAQILADVLAQPDIITTPQHAQSQPEKTHSSIEEPASSWNIPQPGQLPPQIDTISNFTPTNPSIKPSPAVPSPDRGRILPSSLASGINGHGGAAVPANQGPSHVNGSESSQETRHNPSSAPFFPASSRSSELGAVPEMSLEVFKQHSRHVSPDSDIGEFSPRKPSPARPSPHSSERASVRSYQQRLAYQSSPSPGDTWNRARRAGRNSLHSSPSFRHSTGGDTGKQIQEQTTRIQSLLADLANLEAAKKAIETKASAFVESTNQLNEVLQQEREEHAEAIEMQSATILNLEKQLELVRSQYETAESQREFALEQHTRASTEAKRMSDENKVLEAKVEKLERQLSSGLRQWQVGFESNVARHQQEVQMLKGQLTIEREMYARSKAPELCRRAAEWYELKKQIKELEEEAAEAERRETLLRDREIDIRRRELAVAGREQALEDSERATQSHAQTTRLSQDDLQTETMLSDRSVVLAGLNGDLGEELVWMCSYRESTGKICGKVFDSMGQSQEPNTPQPTSPTTSPLTRKRDKLAQINVGRETVKYHYGRPACDHLHIIHMILTKAYNRSQNLYINSVEDFCLWAPPYSDGKNSSIGEVEQIVVSWCVKPGYGTRLTPDGTIKGAHFVQTPDYVQVTGWGDFTKMNIPKGDAGGELDPHGADGLGNPHGGLVFGSTFGKLQQYHEWTNFMSSTEFCIRACKDGPKAAKTCNHIYDVMGCGWNMPGNYDQGVFENCLGDSAQPMGIYGSSTFHQGDPSTPQPHPAPKSSSCTTVSSIRNAGATTSTISTTTTPPATSSTSRSGQTPASPTTTVPNGAGRKAGNDKAPALGGAILSGAAVALGFFIIF
ncbi:hypothetical protein FRC11_009304 [Ceratobasidium sp. 423]|nr:hypothetical protein FRC11_009304 [Ceratobasidium sp. 423]